MKFYKIHEPDKIIELVAESAKKVIFTSFSEKKYKNIVKSENYRYAITQNVAMYFLDTVCGKQSIADVTKTFNFDKSTLYYKIKSVFDSMFLNDERSLIAQRLVKDVKSKLDIDHSFSGSPPRGQN